MSRCTMCTKRKTSPRNRNDGKCSDCLILCDLDWQSLTEYWWEPKPKAILKKTYGNYTVAETNRQRVYMRNHQRDKKICLHAVFAIKNCIGQALTVKVASR